MNTLNQIKEVRQIGFVHVERKSGSVNYSVNMVVAGDEHCGFKDNDGNVWADHSISDARLYDLLGDVKEVITVTDKMVEVKISEHVSARIYKNR